MSKYKYMVEIRRRVYIAYLDDNVYTISTEYKDFPFGKKEKIKTGKEAHKLAIEFAAKQINQFHDIIIWRKSKLTGQGYYFWR